MKSAFGHHKRSASSRRLSTQAVDLTNPANEPVIMAKSLLALDWRRVLVVGSIATIFAFLGAFAGGRISDAKNLALLEAVIPTTQYLSFAVISASATILALMMTVLSFGSGWSYNFRPEYFDKLQQIAILSAISIVAGIFMLLFLNVPLIESESIATWYSILYYFIIGYSSILGGMMIALIFLLYNIVAILIRAVDPHTDTSHIFEESEEKAA